MIRRDVDETTRPRRRKYKPDSGAKEVDLEGPVLNREVVLSTKTTKAQTRRARRRILAAAMAAEGDEQSEEDDDNGDEENANKDEMRRSHKVFQNKRLNIIKFPN